MEPDVNDEGTSAIAERLTIGLTQQAAAALRELRSSSGMMKKADLINRAIVLYAFIDGQMRAGQSLLLRDQDGEIERVRIL